MKSTLLLTSIIISITLAWGQKKQTLTVLNIDSQGFYDLSSTQMGNLVRLEVGKLDSFEVMDKYDVSYLILKNKLSIENCYGKICLIEVGKVIGSDKMIGGSIERYRQTIVIDLRLVDVKTEVIERQEVMEFLDLQPQLQSMIQLTLRRMFDLPVDTELQNKLTQKFNFDDAINNPFQERLNLSGPRMGFTYFTGNNAKYLAEPKDKGGFDALPYMFQFGYQFEAQYLNEGKWQALFEFIPMITGIDQSLIIPSLTIINGLRNNKNGWEIGLGPTIGAISTARGYYDENNEWQLYYSDNPPTGDYQIVSRLDSRGDYKINSGLVIAIGKSFKSGRLNIPFNAYVVPNKQGIRFGISFGFNAKR